MAKFEDVFSAFIDGFQLVNEFKGFPAMVGIDVDLVAANQWWDSEGTPSTAATMVDVAGEGITEDYEYALKVVADGASEGLSQTWTFADEPRVKSGRTMSLIAAIWSVSSLSLTAKLVNSDASETTSGSEITAAAWTIAKIEGHTLAGTSCKFQVTAAGAGTFYVVPLGACIGDKAVPLAPRGLRYVTRFTDNIVAGVDPGGSAGIDLDCTAATSPLAAMVAASVQYKNFTTAYQTFQVRPNGLSDWHPVAMSTTSGNQLAYIISCFQVLLDDAQIFEWKTTGAAGDSEDTYISLLGYWEWN